MINTLANAFMDEREPGKETLAGTGFRKTIELAETFGPIADIYQAMGYMGLSRLYQKRGLDRESDSFARKASHLTHYRFILEERAPGSR